jgi:hypothetical protein
MGEISRKFPRLTLQEDLSIDHTAKFTSLDNEIYLKKRFRRKSRSCAICHHLAYSRQISGGSVGTDGQSGGELCQGGSPAFSC